MKFGQYSKTMVNFKIYDVTTCETKIAMHMLSVKFGQLIECTTRNIFLENSYTKRGVETIPRSFSKKTKLSIYLIQQSKILYSLFLLYFQVEGYGNILKLSCRPLAFTSHITFLKDKKRSATSLPGSFST